MKTRIEVDKNVVLVLFNAPERVTKHRAENKCRLEPTSPVGEVGLPGPGEG